jgi:hypothetical protein
MAKINDVADGAEYPMLVHMAETQSVTHQARSVFAESCAASRIALLGSSPIDWVIANFTMILRTLPYPTRFLPPVMGPQPGFSILRGPDLGAVGFRRGASHQECPSSKELGHGRR